MLPVVVGCDGGGGDTTADRTTPSLAPPSGQVLVVSSAEDVARAKAVEVYERYDRMRASVEAGSALDQAALEKTAIGRAVSLLQRIAGNVSTTGIALPGASAPPAPGDVVVSLSSTTPIVTLAACVDVTGRRPVHRDRTPALIATRASRYTLTRDAIGIWRVADLDAQRDGSC
ncbi:hypothetical protein ACWGR4_35650 [Embleya sp. NPDC055664]